MMRQLAKLLREQRHGLRDLCEVDS